jgi:hypothetical protein
MNGKNQLDDILLTKDALLEWLKTNPDQMKANLFYHVLFLFGRG